MFNRVLNDLQFFFFKFTVDVSKGSGSDCNLLLKQRQERFIDLPY